MLDMGFIGAGITGTALAVCLNKQGYPVKAVYSRSYNSAQKLASRINSCISYRTAQEVADNARFVFITTPDDFIEPVASSIRWCDKHYVIHCSGAHSTDILKSAKDTGAYTGGFHPLQTFADTEQAIKNIPGSTFGIESQEPLLSMLINLAESMEGKYVIIKPEDKVLYHIAAVIACNYLVTLVKLATDIWHKFGVSDSESINALMPLIRGTLNNIENIGLPHCLTGPIARGDIGTVKKHLQALLSESVHMQTGYKELGRQTVPIALAKGKIDSTTANDLLAILK